jgi:ActR/RegA family two-component response regulator
LIVSADSEWCKVYERAAARAGIYTVRVTRDVVSAAALIEEMEFSVAIVDDDQNVDGRHVMEIIRAAGDETSIVVFTDGSRTDLPKFIREAVVKFHAHNVLDKQDIELGDIEDALEIGRENFKKRR